MSQSEPICGGLGTQMKVDSHIQNIVLKFRLQVEKILNRKLTYFEPISYRSQIVAGINYFVKCHIGGEDYIHIQIFEPLPCYQKEPELVKVHPTTKTFSDPIEFLD